MVLQLCASESSEPGSGLTLSAHPVVCSFFAGFFEHGLLECLWSGASSAPSLKVCIFHGFLCAVWSSIPHLRHQLCEVQDQVCWPSPADSSKFYILQQLVIRMTSAAAGDVHTLPERRGTGESEFRKKATHFCFGCTHLCVFWLYNTRHQWPKTFLSVS